MCSNARLIIHLIWHDVQQKIMKDNAIVPKNQISFDVINNGNNRFFRYNNNENQLIMCTNTIIFMCLRQCYSVENITKITSGSSGWRQKRSNYPVIYL